MIHSVPGAGTRYRATNTASGFGRFFVRRCFCCCFRELDVCGGPRENNEKSNIRVLFCFSPPPSGGSYCQRLQLKATKSCFPRTADYRGRRRLTTMIICLCPEQGSGGNILADFYCRSVMQERAWASACSLPVCLFARRRRRECLLAVSLLRVLRMHFAPSIGGSLSSHFCRPTPRRLTLCYSVPKYNDRLTKY